MLDNETAGNSLDTRAPGASTPSLNPSGNPPKETEAEKRVREFLEQEDSLKFREDKDYYAKVKEEEDDDEVKWYPMYISYSRRERAEAVNEALTQKKYTTFLYTEKVPKACRKNPNAPSVAVFSSMVFVKAMKIQLKLLKRFAPNCNMMKFVTRPYHDEDGEEITEVITIPQKQMEHFMGAAQASDPDNQRKFLEYTDYLEKIGQKVKIIDGPFKGIEGEIKRIERHRIVVVQLRDVKLAIGIFRIPPENLRVLEPNPNSGASLNTETEKGEVKP